MSRICLVKASIPGLEWAESADALYWLKRSQLIESIGTINLMMSAFESMVTTNRSNSMTILCLEFFQIPERHSNIAIIFWESSPIQWNRDQNRIEFTKKSLNSVSYPMFTESKPPKIEIASKNSYVSTGLMTNRVIRHHIEGVLNFAVFSRKKFKLFKH